jgi:dTDP-4-dehydrorhamnose reductase
MKVLLTGCGGLLAPYIQEAFEEAGHDVRAISRVDFDLGRRSDVRAILNLHNPDVVVHAAAMTDVEACERSPILALRNNRDATSYLATMLNPQAKLVYISSDMVYADVPGPHPEHEVAPINVYARSKFAGEKAAAVNPRHLIVRTNFFGPSKTPGKVSFSDWVIEILQDGATAVFFSDVWWSPLHMKTLSAVILELVKQDITGIYNVGATTGLSKAQFAARVAALKKLDMGKWTVGPSHFITRRPKDMTLDCSKLVAKGIKLPTVEEEIGKL